MGVVAIAGICAIAMLRKENAEIALGRSLHRSQPRPQRWRSRWATPLAWLSLSLLLAVSLGALSPSFAQAPQLETQTEAQAESQTGAAADVPGADALMPDAIAPGTDGSTSTETTTGATTTGATTTGEPETETTEAQPSQTNSGQTNADPPIYEQAPVKLNGLPIFKVGSSAQLTAEERATTVSQRLQTFIDEQGQAGVEPDIKIDQRNGSPTLLLNDTLLLTVTAADADPVEQRPEALAQIWETELEGQLQLAIEEQSPDYWRQRAVTALGIFGITMMLHVGIVMAMRRFREWLGQKLASYDPNAEPPKLLNVAFRIAIAVMLIVLWLSSLSYAAELFPITRRLSYGLRKQTLNTLTAPIIPIGEGYSVVQLIVLAVLFVALILVSGALTDLLKSRFLNALGISRGVQEAIATVFKYSFIALSSIVLLQLWGIDLSSLAIFASALSVGIGFGLQDIAKNFGSGLVLVFERPIQVGDFVEVGGYSGTIEKLGARSTMIRTLDNLDVFVPNSSFLENEVTNWSHNRSSTRIKIPVGVAYGSDLKAVEEALLEAAASSKNIVKMPEPTVFFLGFGDSSLDFVLLVWIARPQQHVRIKSELNFKVDAAFRRRNIEIPFPQRDLHLRSGNLPVEVLHQELNGSAKAVPQMDAEQ